MDYEYLDYLIERVSMKNNKKDVDGIGKKFKGIPIKSGNSKGEISEYLVILNSTFDAFKSTFKENEEKILKKYLDIANTHWGMNIKNISSLKRAGKLNSIYFTVYPKNNTCVYDCLYNSSDDADSYNQKFFDGHTIAISIEIDYKTGKVKNIDDALEG